ncbi:unnamed protein product, partial [Ectocarpus fasciculatus]
DLDQHQHGPFVNGNMRAFVAALVLWAAGVANGINSCLDSDHDSYRCRSGTTQMVRDWHTTSLAIGTLSLCADSLTDSDIEDVASCFDNAGRTSVTVMYLTQTLLTSLPLGLFDGLPSLYRLHLSHNQLASLPAGPLDGLDALQEIYLSNNQLDSLPAGLFDGLDALQEM